MNTRKCLLAGAIVVLFFLTIKGINLMRRGFSAVDQPSQLEISIARNLRRLAIPVNAKRANNPYRGRNEFFSGALHHWREHCAVCHAIDGRGDTAIGRGLYPKASDMTSSNVQNLSDGELFYIISNGIRFTGMPGWRNEDSVEEIWKLVSFIRHLPNLSEDENRLLKTLEVPADKKRMQAGGDDAGAHSGGEEHGHEH